MKVGTAIERAQLILGTNIPEDRIREALRLACTRFLSETGAVMKPFVVTVPAATGEVELSGIIGDTVEAVYEGNWLNALDRLYTLTSLPKYTPQRIADAGRAGRRVYMVTADTRQSDKRAVWMLRILPPPEDDTEYTVIAAPQVANVGNNNEELNIPDEWMGPIIQWGVCGYAADNIPAMGFQQPHMARFEAWLAKIRNDYRWHPPLRVTG